MSQLRHVELADEYESIKTNTNYVLGRVHDALASRLKGM